MRLPNGFEQWPRDRQAEFVEAYNGGARDQRDITLQRLRDYRAAAAPEDDHVVATVNELCVMLTPVSKLTMTEPNEGE